MNPTIYFKQGVPVTIEVYNDNKLLSTCQINEKEGKAASNNIICNDWINFMANEYKEARPYTDELPQGSDPRR